MIKLELSDEWLWKIVLNKAKNSYVQAQVDIIINISQVVFEW